MSNTVLELHNVVRIYKQGGQSLRVLDQLSLKLERGEVVALVGPSGSGKTTLLQIAGLLDRPDAGEIVINGEQASSASDGKRTIMRRKYIGFVYQFHHLLPEFSALENVVLPQMMMGVPKEEAAQKAAILLRELGLAERLDHRPAKLSGGEQQRVALARALANDPPLLLADEPTGNLDPVTAENVFNLMMRLVREKKLAVLVATHNLDLARRMDRSLRLEGGLLRK